MYSDVKNILNIKNKNKIDIKICEVKVDKCEKEVGYHLLGDTQNNNINTV